MSVTLDGGGGNTPLCPAGHLPHKGGEWLAAADSLKSSPVTKFAAVNGELWSHLICSPPLWGRCPAGQRGVILARLAKTALTLILLTGLALAGHGAYIKAKSALSQVLLARAFDQQLAGIPDAKPWPWADFTIAGRIEVPRIAQSQIIIAGASGQAMAFGPGHMLNTPDPGDNGTAVIAAHRDTHFAWLKDVTIGDTIRLTNPDGKVLEFTVTGTRVAKWNDSGINAHALGRHMNLITCWPFDSKFHGDLRYIVETELENTTAMPPLTGHSARR